jgi:hypothetical protein
MTVGLLAILEIDFAVRSLNIATAFFAPVQSSTGTADRPKSSSSGQAKDRRLKPDDSVVNMATF